MVNTAVKMLVSSRGRAITTALGVTFVFFLIAAQVGLLVGWCRTNSAIVLHAGVDVWVMAEQTPAFDYGTGIPRRRIQQTRTVPGVEWAEGMFMGWNEWQRADGRRITIELVGLDDDCVGGPWQMKTGSVAVVQHPETVIVDELSQKDLGIEQIGDEAEIVGKRAVVGAFSTNVRTFTAAPWVFTSLESAIKYDRRSDSDEITYVMVRCDGHHSPEAVRDAIMAHVPDVEALTTQEFAFRTVRYWMLGTGIGITVVMTALLGLVIGTIIISQTLYAITNDHLADYAALLAIGFSRPQLMGVIVGQSLLMGASGSCAGSALFFYAARASAQTPVPLEMTSLIFCGIVASTLSCCVLAALISIRSIFRIDPVVVFKA